MFSCRSGALLSLARSSSLHRLPQRVGLTAMVAPRAGKLCCAVTMWFAFLFGEPFFFCERKMVVSPLGCKPNTCTPALLFHQSVAPAKVDRDSTRTIKDSTNLSATLVAFQPTLARCSSGSAVPAEPNCLTICCNPPPSISVTP